MLLAGDIGGTKTKLAIYELADKLTQPVVEETLVSGQYSDLETLVQAFLRKNNHPIDYACFGVAGPVANGRAQLTNLPWKIDAAQLEQALACEVVSVLNDLQATGYAIAHLQRGETVTIQAGQAKRHGNIAILAPGTGLGEAFLTFAAGQYRVHPSEGGHVEFGPRTAQEVRLLSYMLARFDHVSYENICSGVGVPNLFNFLVDSEQYVIEPWLQDQLNQVDDKTHLILQTALNPSLHSKVCDETLRLFVSILGAACGNLALKVLPTAGFYLAGGIAIALQEAIKQPIFYESFIGKGRLSHMLTSIPIHIADANDLALRGAASYGMQQSSQAVV